MPLHKYRVPARNNVVAINPRWHERATINQARGRGVSKKQASCSQQHHVCHVRIVGPGGAKTRGNRVEVACAAPSK